MARNSARNGTDSASVNTRKAAAKFRKDAKSFTAKATASQKKARDTLVALGIYTPSGKLSKRYSK